MWLSVRHTERQKDITCVIESKKNVRIHSSTQYELLYVETWLSHKRHFICFVKKGFQFMTLLYFTTLHVNNVEHLIKFQKTKI